MVRRGYRSLVILCACMMTFVLMTSCFLSLVPYTPSPSCSAFLCLQDPQLHNPSSQYFDKDSNERSEVETNLLSEPSGLRQTKIHDRRKLKRKLNEKTHPVRELVTYSAGNVPDPVSPQKKNVNGSFRPLPALHQVVLDNGLNCSKLWHGNKQEVSRALTELNGTLPGRRPAGFYQNITRDCRRYREEEGYILTSSAQEREFPLAFSLMVYKESEQVERLLRAVYRPHNVYCVHIDLKTSPQVLRDIRALIKCLPNVVEAPRQLDVVWGKFSVLHMELICMQALWATRTPWKYVINLTGQEFPLKTNKELVDILTVYNGANDILGEIPKKHYRWRWEKAGKPPHNITVAKGPVHVAASRGFVDFALHAKQAQDFLEWTKKTGIPDETFFATLANMHEFGVPGSYTGNLNARHHIMLNRFKFWDSSNKTCSGRFVRHICHYGPREVATLTHSRHLVANKFSYDLHPVTLDCLEQWYFRRVRKEEETGRVEVDVRPYGNLLLVRQALRPNNSLWG